ncbi:TRAP-type mannitol/chloroaromatic compound transport system, small permease component [Tistlia consotensis]|uniref:TRAP transporter small permease protein n=1 Tax=Tistlia consotensis USBA 355 TaxID=560819 RepID=A0A1Y6CEC7_9PROT|nr:TRAP transporter small permease subunit [Tistlia consotensis]SMF58315.1 TRAP-type mannitol/chloroaromatic compound transport system, small permease component [Tistlia consotensis USBA 355]SNR63199.1 TRAP-type mannitol/chloroaromatic compound transport system, small permease component [Tistlia consotensis]
MERYIHICDTISAWFGKAFAWSILIMTFGTGYEVFVRYVLNDPTNWAFDLQYMMYGTLFMMAGAYTLSRDGHVRGDVVYRLLRPRVQASIELVLYIIFFFPGITALVVTGWKYASRSYRYLEVSVMSPAGVPIFHFKFIMVAAAALLFIQGTAQVCRCLLCLKNGYWPEREEDVEEMEKLLKEGDVAKVLSHGSEAIDIVRPEQPERRS